MPTVETVRGPVDLATLGPTLMHEHIFVLDPSALENYAHAWGESWWDEEVRVADAVFVREIREDIDDTGVRAAFLKCAVEQHGLIGDVPRILSLIAAASIETGAPVMVHTNAVAQTGLLALDALTGAGVDPTRIVIAHAGDSNDLGYLRAIADTGASLGRDRFGIEHFNPDVSASRRSRRWSRRATRTACTSATTRPASTTSCPPTRPSPTSSPTTCTSRTT